MGGLMGFGGQQEKPSIKLPDGESVAISDLISYKLTEGVSGVDHEDGRRTVTITAGTAPGYEAERIINRIKTQLPGIKKRLAKNDPAIRETEVKFAGETMFIERATRNLTLAMITSIVLIYFILLLEFRSTTQPLIILICVPYALVGVILGLLIMSYPFSILAGIGLLCLIGIVVNNGIIYIDYANLLQKRGMELRAACIEACRTRMRPIVLTKATVILGIVPLAMASASKTQFWKPLCWAVIWGLIIATTLTLIIIPVVYFVIEKARGRFYEKHPPLEADGNEI
jgi:HAE1 family hydrophobic/amphiphilic exporter-1